MCAMVALIVATFLASKSASDKANVVVWCIWDAFFLANGALATLTPAGWLRLGGTSLSKPLSPALKTFIRGCGVVIFLVGVIGVINLSENFSAYWKGVY